MATSKENGRVENGGNLVKLVFLLPDKITKVIDYIPKNEQVVTAWRKLCNMQGLDFNTTRFLLNEQVMIWRMTAEKIWQAAMDRGETEILIKVVTGYQPYRNRPAVQPIQVEAENFDEGYMSFSFSYEDQPPEIFQGEFNETFDQVFERFADGKGIDYKHLRFVGDGGRMNPSKQVGAFRREIDDEDAEAFEITVFDPITGG